MILADEPTAALDPRYQLIVLDILRKRAEAGGAVLAALHDIGLAARRATRVIVLDGGRIVADGPPRQVLTKERLAETFGVNAADRRTARCAGGDPVERHGAAVVGTGWRPRPESNRGSRICSPVHGRSATRPISAGRG